MFSPAVIIYFIFNRFTLSVLIFSRTPIAKFERKLKFSFNTIPVGLVFATCA